MNTYIIGRSLHRNILLKNDSWSLELTQRQKADFRNTFLLYDFSENILICGPWLVVTYAETILQKKWEV